LKADRPLDDPSSLAYYNLLHDATTKNWSAWFALAGVDDVNANRGTILDDTNVLIQAAIDGQGVALGSLVFVAEHLESGRLVRPFELVLESDLAYHIVCPEEYLSRQSVNAFRNWVLDEAGA
jgi:LysR family glycine cleavage system transcriptional activator